MNNTDYNNYMLNLYRECTLKISDNRTIEPHYTVQRYFEQAASSFNQNIAIEYLDRLHLKNHDLIQKMQSYPYMFWKTPESTMQITKGLEKLQTKHQTNVLSILEDVNAKNQNFNYTPENILHDANLRLNGELGSYDDLFGTGILKQFSKDMLQVHLGLGNKSQVVSEIKKFSAFTYETLNNINLQVDFSEFPKYLKKIFKNTNIAEQINNIDFDNLLKLNQSPRKKM